MRLLVVEDETAIANPLAQALSCLDQRYEISRAATLDDAVKLTERKSFDAALVDLTLPDAAGCDIAYALRHSAPRLPIVALTGCDFESVGVDLVRAGAQDYLRKGEDSIQRIHQTLLLAVERESQRVLLQRRATYDELTGVLNRREIEVQLEKAVSHSERNGQLGAVLLIDIDDFKKINDSLGHQAGDSVLRNVAKCMKRSVRAGDSVGRVGGDEFVIVVEGLTNGAQAKRVAEDVLNGCCCSVAIGDSRINITASIGISVFPTDGTSPATLLGLADKAMYESKRNGKATVNGSSHLTS